ncbi:MAG TPA: GNAT family N-acetyltransferase [Devosia sp.]
MASIAIRRIGHSELPIIQQLAEDTWPTAFEGVIERHQIEIMLEDIYALDTLRNDMDELGHVYWIARHDNQDSGFVSAYKAGDTTWIKKLYILPAKQGQGIGRALMAHATAHFAPSRALSLNVNTGNTKAIEFYKKYGFVVEKEVPVKMGPFDFTDYVMTKVL